MKNNSAFSLFASLAVLQTACASTPEARFPAREEVSAIAAAKAAPVKAESRFSTDDWELVGPLPGVVGHVAAPVEGAVAQLANDIFKAREAEPSAALHCVAREVAKILGVTGSYPGRRMQRFLFGACGSPTNTGGFNAWTLNAGDDMPDEKLLQNYRDDLQVVLENGIPQSGRGGVASIRAGGKFVLIMVYSSPSGSTIEPFAATADDRGMVTFKGSVQKRVEVLRPMINQGLYGVARCALNPDVRLPDFEITCPVDPQDQTAWITVSAFEPGRFIGDSVAQILVRPAGAAPEKYSRVDYVASAPRQKDPDAFSLQFVDSLNVVRQKAGLGAVEALSVQSQTAHKLSGHLLRALEDNDDAMAKKISMGFLAGWDVEQPIVNGSVDWLTSYGEDDIADLMATALAWPEGRFTLLHPDYDLLAVGGTSVGERHHFLLAAGWEKFEGHSIEQDSKKAFDSLTRARRQFKRPPGVMPLVDATAQRLAKEIDQGGDAGDAIDELGQFAVSQYQHGMMSWRIYPVTLDDIAWPKELLDAPAVYVSLAVAVERHPKLAWSRNVILLVAHFPPGAKYADTEGTNTTGQVAVH